MVPFGASVIRTLLLSLLLAEFIPSEQLPIRIYTTADGLPRNRVNQIVSDSRGFLWFGTPEGLSRFDGYSFTTYGVDQGLPGHVVNDILEDSKGVLWVAAGGGLARFNPSAARPRFTVYTPGESTASRMITLLYEDHAHRLWCGTLAGLYWLEQAPDQSGKFHFVDLKSPDGNPHDQVVTAILQARSGSLWVGVANRLDRLMPDGRTELYDARHGLPNNVITQVFEDRSGHLWVSTREGLYRIVDQPDPSRSLIERRFSTRDGLGADWVDTLFESSDGKLWATTTGGLSEFVPGRDGGRFRSYTTANGLSDGHVQAIAEDREGNLWLGTESAGAMKVARNGFTSFTIADGLADLRIVSIFEDQAGEVCAVSTASQPTINCFDGSRFHAVRPNYGRTVTAFGWGWYQTVLQDHAGEWWIPTGQGLYRFPHAEGYRQFARQARKAVYTMRDGLASEEAFRVYEDSRGDIWTGPVTTTKTWVSRWERSTNSFHHYGVAEGVPLGWPSAFREAPDGVLWIGYYEGRLVRYWKGRFMILSAADGLPRGLGMVHGLHRDRSGRLWVGTDGGLIRVEDPGAEHPRFLAYRAAQGLSSDAVISITEDQWGRIYVGTGRGVDRFDAPAASKPLNRIKHYTTADGLARGELSVSFQDRQGALWFGSLQGLSRLAPEPDLPRGPPPVLVKALRIRGVAYPVSELGETDLRELQLQPQQNQVQIDFIGLGFGPGESLRYQYKLEPADVDWSAPIEQRSVNYASLAPGTYRFQVRAINADGVSSPKPAGIAFTVVPPLWQRWWFRALVVFLLASVAYTMYRYRLARMLEVERVRTRIATDLHDDIGSSLSQVAILSEVVQRRIGNSDPELHEPLSRIAGVSRELVDSMSDIVWAVNPAKDKLYYLLQRMRQFAGDVLVARDIRFGFRVEDCEHDLRVETDARRQIYLIFKECIHNIVRHAYCSDVEIEIRRQRERLVLRISDNGSGFEPSAALNGHGLLSMAERAKRIGGKADVVTNASGTTVTLDVPLDGAPVEAPPPE
jgi:ligand-binding sensor domain-containing protein/two-component sensor histidine kinase